MQPPAGVPPLLRRKHLFYTIHPRHLFYTINPGLAAGGHGPMLLVAKAGKAAEMKDLRAESEARRERLQPPASALHAAEMKVLRAESEVRV